MVNRIKKKSETFINISLCFRLNRDFDDRCREGHGLQHDRVGCVAQRLARGRVLQAHHRDDVAGAHEVDLLTLVRVHPVDLADALLALLELLVFLAILGFFTVFAIVVGFVVLILGFAFDFVACIFDFACSTSRTFDI